MWRYIKWTFRIVVLLVVGGFLHYTLPRHDVVRIINTYNKLTTIGSNWMFYSSEDTGTGATTPTTGITRDIRFIDAVYPDGTSVMVYRNEDTGWVWPPYFKYDSASLQARATNLKSDKDKPVWVSVTYYGWRVPFFTIYPNAVRIVEVAGPDVRIVPWVNIVILAFLAFGVLMIWRMLAQFRERMIDPAIDQMNMTLDAVDREAGYAKKRARGWWARLTGRS